MNLHIIGIVIRREYFNKVRKRSFLVLTFLVPVLFAALCVLPSLIMLGAKEEAKKIAVVDNSGIVMGMLEDNATTQYQDCSGIKLDVLKASMKDLGFDAVLDISRVNPDTRTVEADIFSTKPLGMDMTENINGRINKAVEAYRVSSYNIEGLDVIMKDVKADIKLHSFTLDEDGKETVSESGVYMLVSMMLGIIIYLFIVMFGGMVMSSVIEEKSSRVVEVLVSSVKATELMFGKIIGVAMVALTQFLLWIALTLVIVGAVSAVAGTDFLSSISSDPASVMQVAGNDAMSTALNAAQSSEVSVITSTLRNLPFAQIISCFILFFLFGYLLYSSLYAAIGSAVENEGDSQQLQLPVTVPLLIGFFMAIYAFKAPDSTLVFWGSIIPFTSPIVMLARLPFGVPFWQIMLSVGLLIVTSGVLAWLSAKVYKVGILMFGKKSTWKDLWKWLKQN